MTNILYFEGAGMDYEVNNESDVTNYRIRTSFKNLDGIQYYIEMGRCPNYDFSKRSPKLLTEWGMRIDHLFKTEDRFREELATRGYEIKVNFRELREILYTKENIVNWINENLNCNFTDMNVLDRFYDYCVHGDNEFNLMEDIELNHERATKRKQAFEKVDKVYREATSSKYSVISLTYMDSKSISIHCHAAEEKLNGMERKKTILI